VQINASIVLEDGDSFAYTADAAATQVLAALGGDPTNDHCTVMVQTMQQGTAGTPSTTAAMEPAGE
jgi:hypothetical protein